MKAGTFVCMVIVRHYVCVFVGVCMFMRKVNLIEVEKKADGNLRMTKEVNIVPMENSGCRREGSLGCITSTGE